MQAASANLTSVMCWVIIAQTIASPDPGNVVLHSLRHLYKRVTAHFTSREKEENWTVFPETAWTRTPTSSWPFQVWKQLSHRHLAGHTGVSSNRERRSGAFPQWWPFIRHDTRWLRGLEMGCGISYRRLRGPVSIHNTASLSHMGWNPFIQCCIPLIFIKCLFLPVTYSGMWRYLNNQDRHSPALVGRMFSSWRQRIEKNWQDNSSWFGESWKDNRMV